jgi:hypothetical protein
MIDHLTFTNGYGASISLYLKRPDLSGFFIKAIDGLGPVKNNINISQAVNFDGGMYNSSRLTSRNIVLRLGYYNDGSKTIEQIRQNSYDYFPMKQELTINVVTDNRNVLIKGYVESNEVTMFSRECGAIISIICPNPNFYDANYTNILFSGIDQIFEFPLENPSLVSPMIEFGSVYTYLQRNIPYLGDQSVGLVFYINIIGSVTTLGIHNLTSGESMVIDSTKLALITGADLTAGDQIILSTVKGSKFIYLVRAGVLWNILNALTSTAVWFNIRKGDNVFIYTAASGLSNIQLYAQHQTMYGGV